MQDKKDFNSTNGSKGENPGINKKKIPTEVDGFLRVIKIRSTTSYGGEVKPSVPCRRFTACKRTLRA
jgi:hypothetical protein